MMVNRFGVDLDSHCGLQLLRTCLGARRFGQVQAYYTRHGFHVEVTLGTAVPIATTLILRRCLGDDPKRLEFDERKIEVGWTANVDTLFEHKQYRDGSTYTRWPFKEVRG